MSFRSVCGGLLAAFVLMMTPLALASPGMAAPHGTVYLMRGLANVFSLGLDTLNDKLNAKGVPSIVTGYAGWQGIAQTIEDRYAKNKGALPIIVMGHSFGADATLYIAAELNRKKIPVALIVTFDVVSDGTAVPYKVRCRPPSFLNVQPIPLMVKGALLADLIPTFDFVNMIGGECDR